MRRLNIILLALPFVLQLVGCRSATVIDPTPRVTAPLAVAKSETAVIHSDHAGARTELWAAKTLTATQPAINAHVTSADDYVEQAEVHTQNVDLSIDRANAAAVELGKALVTVEGQVQTLTTTNYRLEHEFFSPVQKRLFWWLMGGTILLLIVIGFVHGSIWGIPVASFGESIFGAAKTGGLSLFHLLGHFIGGLFHKSTYVATLKPST